MSSTLCALYHAILSGKNNPEMKDDDDDTADLSLVSQYGDGYSLLYIRFASYFTLRFKNIKYLSNVAAASSCLFCSSPVF